MQEPPTFKTLTNGDKLVDEVAALYEDLREPLLRFAFFEDLGDRASHEDLVQDIFVNLIEQVRSGSIIYNPKAWLFKAIHNRGIDGIRKVRSRAKNFKLLPAPSGHAPNATQQHMESAEILERAMSRLNAKERHVLMLRIIGLTYKEISEALDISFESVSVYRNRALTKLRFPG